MKIAAKIILLPFCIMSFSSCNIGIPLRYEPFSSCNIGIPLRYEPSDNNDSYTIQYLFQHDGVKVYRFYDKGNYVYFTTRGDVTSIKTDSTKEKTITFHHEDSIIRPFR